MNKQAKDILNILINNPFSNQRELAEYSRYSLGGVNKSIKELIKDGYLHEDMSLTLKTYSELEKCKPQNAIILAAGYGMRMVPIATEVPKGLLEVNGEPLIERTIKQLKEVEINQIYIVVGFMKEQYEYLMDKYNVKLIVNEKYSEKNNLHSLKKALKYLKNTYIVPCDVWCKNNPFSKQELYSWYMVSDITDDTSTVRVNRKNELAVVEGKNTGNKMIGISYLLDENSKVVIDRIKQLSLNRRYDNAFWEEALYKEKKMIVYPKVVKDSEVVEINTYEQLRELDSTSRQLKSDVIDEISNAMQVPASSITNISVLKKGMTNRSFYFQCDGNKYIMRIPGEGTDYLINRVQEAKVYDVIKDKDICDDIMYINPANGYKITRYLDNVRNCNPENMQEIKLCMKRLRKFHEMKLSVEHSFDIFGQIEFYEQLWEGRSSVYRDYLQTKENVISLKRYIDEQPKERVLTHIDAVPDNFLFVQTESGEEDIRLIDWEYAGMQDPHVDIAMFCIYSLYEKEQVDQTIEAYFTEGCEKEIYTKIYCYIAVCGLLWSNWCEYKRSLGVEFGEYSLRQYRYAKEYFRIVQNDLINKEDER